MVFVGSVRAVLYVLVLRGLCFTATNSWKILISEGANWTPQVHGALFDGKKLYPHG